MWHITGHGYTFSNFRWPTNTQYQKCDDNVISDVLCKKEICPVLAKFLEEASAPNWLNVKEGCGSLCGVP